MLVFEVVSPETESRRVDKLFVEAEVKKQIDEYSFKMGAHQ